MPRNASKPKRKLKTHRGAAKRMRKLKKLTQVSHSDKAKTMQMLPYGL